MSEFPGAKAIDTVLKMLTESDQPATDALAIVHATASIVAHLAPDESKRNVMLDLLRNALNDGFLSGVARKK